MILIFSANLIMTKQSKEEIKATVIVTVYP